METKDLSLSVDNSGLKFKCTNLSELRDEAIYMKLKQDVQREYLLLIFLYNLLYVYMDYYFFTHVCSNKKDGSYNRNITQIREDKKHFLKN